MSAAMDILERMIPGLLVAFGMVLGIISAEIYDKQPGCPHVTMQHDGSLTVWLPGDGREPTGNEWWATGATNECVVWTNSKPQGGH
jgi:hypothetical protein